jgi:uracil-DNA glycosylase family protein
MASEESGASKRTRQRKLDEVRKQAETCKRCDLWRTGTQTVFGEGKVDADVMFVGEQPGDVEDVQGRPFVGPAGRVLQQAMAAAGLSGLSAYVTNAVKHFKWEPRGKRRLHMRPNTAELLACRFWLEEEIENVKPKVLVALGATAARVVLGPGVRVLKDRGRWKPSAWGPQVLVTVHPSSVLRAQDPESRKAGMEDLIADLREVAKQLGKAKS